MTRGRARCAAMLGLSLVLAACGSDTDAGRDESEPTAPAAVSEPVYAGIAMMGRNYLPFNLSRFKVTDAYGNQAGGGGDDPPGQGGGSTTCCYTLRGTKFKVEWRYYDADEWIAGSADYYHAEADVELDAASEANTGIASVMAVHFYPDMHVEMEFPSKLSSPPRVPITGVSRSLRQHHDELNRLFPDDGVRLRSIAKLVVHAWSTYRIVDQGDLEQYVLRALTLGASFDSYPTIREMLLTAKDHPGQFEAFSQGLSSRDLSKIAAFAKRTSIRSPPATSSSKKVSL